VSSYTFRIGVTNPGFNAFRFWKPFSERPLTVFETFSFVLETAAFRISDAKPFFLHVVSVLTILLLLALLFLKAELPPPPPPYEAVARSEESLMHFAQELCIAFMFGAATDTPRALFSVKI